MPWWRKQATAGSVYYRAWLNKFRTALKQDPRRKPPFDPDTASDAELLHFVFTIAEEVISADFFTHLEEARLEAAREVAAQLGAEIVTNEEGALSVEPGKNHVPPRMVH